MVNVVKNKVGLFNVVQFPCMTTKAKYLNEKRNQIVIFVSLDATKIDIINAVELAFGIEVAKVNVMIKKGKNKGEIDIQEELDLNDDQEYEEINEFN